jgi:hypothetical protein
MLLAYFSTSKKRVRATTGRTTVLPAEPRRRACASANPAPPTAARPPRARPVPPALRDASILHPRTPPSLPHHTPPPLPHRHRPPPPSRTAAVPRRRPHPIVTSTLHYPPEKLDLNSATASPIRVFVVSSARRGRMAAVRDGRPASLGRGLRLRRPSTTVPRVRAGPVRQQSTSFDSGGPFPLRRRPSTRISRSTQGRVKQQLHRVPHMGTMGTSYGWVCSSPRAAAPQRLGGGPAAVG